MPLIGKVGRKAPRARLALGLVYVVLCLGAIATAYPFLLMVSTGFTGTIDQNENKLIPKFWNDDERLAEKVWDDKYSGVVSLVASVKSMPESQVSPQEYEAFLMDLPPDYWMAGYKTAPTQVTGKLQMRYQQWLMKRYPAVDALNKAYIEENPAFQTVTPPTELLDRPEWDPPKNSRKWTEWLEFKAELPADFRIPVRSERMAQEFARVKFQNQFPEVPVELIGNAKSFEELRLGPGHPLYDEFAQLKLPPRYKAATMEQLWQQKHKGPMPIEETQAYEIQQNAREYRDEFTSRNYRYVLDYIALNGRALWNTAFFCLLTILVQLIVNPIAAYALSRFPMPTTGKVLTFLLATMAFPAEVAMIPSFLLLKDLNLLNTFAALVLPAAASGYMIYLLKGFFDSLPQELYESGQLDGAKELTMMSRIAFPLSKPVLGYLSLLAFMGAYSAFMFAFLVCQDRSMWTLMVFIYQLQNTAPRAVMMAALTLAAIPTLVVFLLCQRVIMRGIVLPGER